MANLTHVLARQRLSENLDDYRSQSLTSNGNAGGTAIVDTTLAQLSPDTDFCKDWWVQLTSGTYSGQIRKVSAYATSTTTITLISAFGGQVLSGVTYELHVIHPTAKLNALNRGLEELYPSFLYLPLRDKTLVLDNLLSNSDFESYTSPDFANWTRAETAAAETTIYFHGSQSAKLTSGAAAVAQLYQAPTININEVTGKTVTFWGQVYATAASAARLRLSFDGGSTFTNHAYHSGDDQWERQTLAVAVPTTATSIRAYCEVATGTLTGYFDAVRMYINKVNKLTIPTTIDRLHGVLQQRNIDREADDADYDPMGQYSAVGWQAGRRLLLIGAGPLTRFTTTETSTTEIDSTSQVQHVNLLTAYAARWLSRQVAMSPTVAAQDVERQLRNMGLWDEEVKRLQAQPGIRMAQPATMLRESWNTERDASGFYLILKGR